MTHPAPCILFAVTLPSRDDWVDGVYPAAQIGLFCYTDGPRMKGGSGAVTGAGVHFSEPDLEAISCPLGGLSTVFQCEVTAIILCAETLLERQVGTFELGSTTIFSDSQSALLPCPGSATDYLRASTQLSGTPYAPVRKWTGDSYLGAGTRFYNP